MGYSVVYCAIPSQSVHHGHTGIAYCRGRHPAAGTSHTDDFWPRRWSAHRSSDRNGWRHPGGADAQSPGRPPAPDLDAVPTAARLASALAAHGMRGNRGYKAWWLGYGQSGSRQAPATDNVISLSPPWSLLRPARNRHQRQRRTAASENYADPAKLCCQPEHAALPVRPVYPSFHSLMMILIRDNGATSCGRLPRTHRHFQVERPDGYRAPD